MTGDAHSRRDFLWQAAGAGIAASALATAPAPAQGGRSGAVAPGTDIRPLPCTLLPQQNRWRSTLDLSGLWDFQIDPTGEGESQSWFNGLPASRLTRSAPPYPPL